MSVPEVLPKVRKTLGKSQNVSLHKKLNDSALSKKTYFIRLVLGCSALGTRTQFPVLVSSWRGVQGKGPTLRYEDKRAVEPNGTNM